MATDELSALLAALERSRKKQPTATPDGASPAPSPRGWTGPLQSASGGRPRALDEEAKRLIAALVSHGITLRAAAAYAGVHRDTVLAERRRDAGFDFALTRAKDFRNVDPLMEISRAAKTSWRAAAWLLQYRERQQDRARGARAAKRDRTSRSAPPLDPNELALLRGAGDCPHPSSSPWPAPSTTAASFSAPTPCFAPVESLPSEANLHGANQLPPSEENSFSAPAAEELLAIGAPTEGTDTTGDAATEAAPHPRRSNRVGKLAAFAIALFGPNLLTLKGWSSSVASRHSPLRRANMEASQDFAPFSTQPAAWRLARIGHDRRPGSACAASAPRPASG